MPTSVAADLTFTVEADDRRITGRLTGSGSCLDLLVDDPVAFAGAGDAAAVRWIGEELAARGLQVRVLADDTVLVCLGDVHAPWWQRRLTGSRHLRVGSLKGLWTAAQARAAGRDPVLPGLLSAPPPALLPMLPSLTGNHRRPRTTHDPARAGGARLVHTPEIARPGAERVVYWLSDDVVIGSDPSCDIVLSGLAPRHCRVLHDERDEYVVEALEGPVRVHGRPTEHMALHFGARLEIGEQCLVFAREEYADHGRPYGGRVGGEAGHQRPQAARPGAQSS